MELRMASKTGKDAQDESTKGPLAGGCCFDFNKAQDHLFVVGTEEGHIHKCSQAYNSEYLQSYAGTTFLSLFVCCKHLVSWLQHSLFRNGVTISCVLCST